MRSSRYYSRRNCSRENRPLRTRLDFAFEALLRLRWTDGDGMSSEGEGGIGGYRVGEMMARLGYGRAFISSLRYSINSGSISSVT